MGRKKKLEKSYIAIVLDRSGSMASAHKETVTGFNEQVQAIKDKSDPSKVDTRISLTLFNHDVEEKLFDAPVADLNELKMDDYHPDGMTAMYDGVAHAIDRLLVMPDIERADTSVLIVIISDGYENASKKVDSRTLAEKIQRLKETQRWVFTYMGANQDLSVVSKQLNIDLSNMASFSAASPGGYAKGMNIASLSTAAFVATRNSGKVSMDNFYPDPHDTD